MVMAWLINSMEAAIGQTYLFLPTAKDLWDAVQETYSDLGNAAQMFEIKTKLKDIKHGSYSVTQYYNILQNAWQELDLFSNMEWKCAEDSAYYCKILEKKGNLVFWQDSIRNLMRFEVESWEKSCCHL